MVNCQVKTRFAVGIPSIELSSIVVQDTNGLEFTDTFRMQWCIPSVVRCVDVSVIIQKKLTREKKRIRKGRKC